MAKALETFTDAGNGAAATIATEIPYVVEVRLQGTAPMLFHRWDCESIDEKSKAKKGSKAKKEDDINSYVYRNEDGDICLPGEYVRQSIIHAAKFRQDPRSPRKSAMDLFKAGVASMTELASLGSKDWDYLDRRRVTVQRSGITRSRPAFKAGWQAHLQFMILIPEYIDPQMFHETLNQAGRLIGLADFRPTYGRFAVTHFEVLKD